MVSIIVPVYNCEKYIAECLNSLCRQKGKESLEILVINDGSTDSSGEICDKYSNEYSQIKVIHSENKGVSNARNIGIENATGEWIMFVDGDDLLNESAIDILYKETKFCQYDVVRFGAYQFNDLQSKTFCSTYSTDLECYRELVLSRKTMLGVWGGIYRRDLFIKHNIRFDRDIRIGEDWIVLFKLLCHTHSFKFHEQELYGYRINLDSVTWKRIDYVRPDAMIAFGLILDYAKKQHIKFKKTSIYIAKSELRRNVMKEAILNNSRTIYKETEYALNRYAPQSLWKDILYSQKLKHKIGFIVYKFLSWIYCNK